MIRLYKAPMVAPVIVLIKRDKFLEFIYFSSSYFKSERGMRVEESLKQRKPLQLEPARLPILLDHMCDDKWHDTWLAAQPATRLVYFSFNKILLLKKDLVMFDALQSSEEYNYLSLIFIISANSSMPLPKDVV